MSARMEQRYFNGYEKLKATAFGLGVFKSSVADIKYMDAAGPAYTTCATKYSSSLQGNNDRPDMDDNITANHVSGLHLCFQCCF